VLPSVHIARLHHEGLRSVVFFAHDQTSHHHSVAGKSTKISRPVLGGGDGRAVDNNLISQGVKSSCGLEGGNVGAVAEFGLCVTTENL